MNSQGQNSALIKRRDPSLSLVPFGADTSAMATIPEGQTFSGLLHVLRRRWGAVCVVGSATFALGLSLGLITTPQYTSTTTIEINKDNESEQTAAREIATTPTSDEIKTEVQTDIAVLESDGLALSVIRDLDLLKQLPFRNAIDGEDRGKTINQAPRTREKVLKLFAKHLKVDSPPDTRLISVTFQNPDANLAAKVANTLSEAFILNATERRHRSISQASRWLQKQLEALKQQVEESERKLAKYERETGLAGIQLSGAATVDGTTSVSLSPRNTVTERLFALNEELTAAEANRISTEIMYRLVKTQDPEVVLGLGPMTVANTRPGASGALTADGGIQQVRALRSQEAVLNQDYAAAAVKYGENNPKLAEIRDQINAVKDQMKAELQRVSERAENDYLYAAKNEDAIRQQFAVQQSEANVLADKTVKLQVLAQEAYSNQGLYENLFSKLQAANLASSVRATRLDVLNIARPAGIPSFPPWEKGLPVLAALSVLFGFSAAFLRQSLDETVRSSRDLEHLVDVPLLPYIPTLVTKRVGATRSRQSSLIEAPNSSFSEAFRSLRTSIIMQTATFSRKLFLVTSPSSGDGKTAVAYNLGVAFAQQGARVLLIDADLRRPKLHLLFGCGISPGVGDLREYVSGSTIEGIVEHPHLPKLSILPAGKTLEFPTEFFGSSAFAAVLEMSGRQFDYVLIDSPPVLSVADASIIATKVTGTIAVLRSGSTTRPILSGLVDALRRTGTPTIGVLLNDVRKPNLDGFYEYTYRRRKRYELRVRA